MKPKSTKRTTKRKVPKALDPENVMSCLKLYDETPSDFWDQVESTWDWDNPRRRGSLADRMEALDAHFKKLGETHYVCPVILLLNRGPK